jgi:hypothetical protein
MISFLFSKKYIHGYKVPSKYNEKISSSALGEFTMWVQVVE